MTTPSGPLSLDDSPGCSGADVVFGVVAVVTVMVVLVPGGSVKVPKLDEGQSFHKFGYVPPVVRLPPKPAKAF